MKNATKRLLAALLALGMLFTLTSVFAEEDAVAIAEEENDVTEDASDENEALRAEYAEEIALLNGLGILSTANVDMSANISRVEFLELVMKLIKMNDLDTTDIEEVFSDVLKDSEYYKTVMNAYRIGLVNGTPESAFNPDVDIDAAAALKILVCALEYGELGMMKGGYPMGYISVARDLDITKRTKTSGTIIWKDAVIMIYNALNSKASVETYSDAGKLSIKIGEDTVLAADYDIEKRTGIVEETNFSFRMKNEEKTETVLQIDGKLYDNVALAENEANDLLGKSVIYYVKAETEELICIVENAKKNNVTVIADDDIASANLTSVKYWDANDKEASLRIGKDADFYYNGQLSDEVVAADMEPEQGQLTLIDNNGDKLVDVVMIEDWYDVIMISCSDKTLSSLYEDNKDINLKDVDLIFYKNNMEITTNFIEGYDVAKIMLSKDGKSGLAMVSGWDMTGNLEKISKKDDKTYFTVDGTDYEVSPVYIEAYERGDMLAPVPYENNRYRFRLDGDDVIFGIDKVSKTDFVYGYLLNVAKAGGLDETYKVKIYGENGAFLKLDVSDKIKVNDERVPNFYDAICGNNGEFVSQLVMYKVDEKDKNILAEIRLAKDTRSGEPTNDNYDVSKFSLDYSKESGWSTGNNTVGKNKYYVVNSGQVPQFRIPYDRDAENDYKWVNAYGTVGSYTSNSTVYVYDLVPFNEKFPGVFRVGAMVVEQRKPTSSSSGIYNEEGKNSNQPADGALMWMVTDVYEEIDEEGEVYTVIDAKSHKGNPYTFKCFSDAENLDHDNLMGYKDVSIDELRQGDMIRIHYDNPNYTKPMIDRFMVYARNDAFTEEEDWYKVVYTKYSTSEAFVFGSVVWKDNYGWICYSEQNGVESYKLLTSASNVWEYSVSAGQFRINASNNLSSGDKILAVFNWGNPSGTDFVIRIVD